MIFSFCLTFAQQGFKLGLHYSFNNTWIMNKQVFDKGPDMDFVLSTGYYFGSIIAYDFNDNLGIELNVNTNYVNQNYTGKMQTVSDGENIYNSHIKLKTIDIPLMCKYGSKFYFEFGPVFQFVTDAIFSIDFEKETQTILVTSGQNYSDTYTTEQLNLKSQYLTINQGVYNALYYEYRDVSDLNVEDKFYNTGFGLAFGFGANFTLIEDILFLNAGFRVNYILTDYKGVNALGLEKYSEYIRDDERKNFYSKPLYGGIKLGLYYKFQ
ncbi:MAG: hypothetical protein C0596_03080 [Marinilabiliales bacterium]|nr:MAG: hypothetical protein C0596_03080 [Marinilabiliales bacterium]